MLHALYFGRAKTDTAADYSLTQVPRQITKDYYLVLSKYDGDQSFMCHLAQGWSGSFRGCVERWQTDIVARLIIPILPCSSTVYRLLWYAKKFLLVKPPLSSGREPAALDHHQLYSIACSALVVEKFPYGPTEEL